MPADWKPATRGAGPSSLGALSSAALRHAPTAAPGAADLWQVKRLHDEALTIKAEALAGEEFDLAKRAKAVIGSLTVLMAREEELMQLKSEAVWIEDFAAATAVQHKLLSLEAQAKQALQSLTAGGQPAASGTRAPDGATGRSAAGSTKAPGVSSRVGGKAKASGKKGTSAGKKPSGGGKGAASSAAPGAAPIAQPASKGGKVTADSHAADEAMARMELVVRRRTETAQLIGSHYRNHRQQRRAKAALTLELALRRWLVRVRVRARVAQKEQLNAAAVQMQAAMRGAAGRRRGQATIDANTSLVMMVRRWLLRRERARRRAAGSVLHTFFAEVLQARGKWTKLRAGLVQIRQSAVAIEGAARRRAASKDLRRRRVREELKNICVVKMQAAVRGRADRQRVAVLRSGRDDIDRAADTVKRFFELMQQGQEMHERIALISSTLRRASSAIQSAVRVRRARIEVRERREAMKRHSSSEEGQRQAVNVIMSFLDHCHMRQSLLTRVHKLVFESRQATKDASAKLQAAMRGMADRRRSRVLVDDAHRRRKLEETASMLQAAARGMAGRRKSVVFREERAIARQAVLDDMALRMQANVRGRQGRRKSQSIREVSMAQRVQAGVRGLYARRQSLVMRQQIMDVAASRQLQAAMRGRLGRRKSMQLRHRLVCEHAGKVLTVGARGMLTRVRLRHAAAAADATAPIDVVMRLRCAPIARDAIEFATQLARLLRMHSSPLVRVRPMRLLIRPASPNLTAHGTLPTAGGERADDAIVLIVRVMAARIPGEVAHVDAAAALCRIPLATLGVAIGATLAAPLTATLAVAPQPDTATAGTSTALVAPNSASNVSTPTTTTQHLVPFTEVGQAKSEERRAHATHTLLHYMRSLEQPSISVNPVDDAALALPPPEPEVGRPELVASLSTLLPLIREALYAARLSSKQQSEADAAAGDALALALHHGKSGRTPYFGGEATPVRGFVALQRPSPFEAAPRGPAVAGRKLRWVSHRVEICCPPTPYASYDLDGVIEDGANGAVGAYATLAQPMVRAALRGVSGSLLVVGDGAAASSLSLFGELAHPNRLDGALAWAAGVSRGMAGGARRCGLAGLVISELLAESSKWYSGTDEARAGGATGAAERSSPARAGGHAGDGWGVQCSAFQITSAGAVDLLQHPTHEHDSDAVVSLPDMLTGGAPLLGLREWAATDGSVSGGGYSWPHGLARVGVLSPMDFSELLVTLLSRRLVLSTTSTQPSTPEASKFLAQPPVCAPMALVFEIEGITPEGDATSAQIVLWDLPGVVEPPAPPRPPPLGTAAPQQRAALAASVRASTVEARAISSGMHALRTVLETLGRPSTAGHTDNEEAALIAARGHPLTQVLWRALAGDGLTTCLCIANASEWHLPATLEAVQLANTARQLHTRPRPRRVRAAPTLDDLTAMLDEVDARRKDVTQDVTDEVLSSAALAPEDWYDLPARMGYEPLLRELEQLMRLGAGGEMESAVLRRLVRRLLGDVRKLRTVQEVPQDAMLHDASPRPTTPPLELPPPPRQLDVPPSPALVLSPGIPSPVSPQSKLSSPISSAHAQRQERVLEEAAARELALERARTEVAELHLQQRATELREARTDLAEAQARAAALNARMTELEREREFERLAILEQRRHADDAEAARAREVAASHTPAVMPRARSPPKEATLEVESGPTCTGGGVVSVSRQRSPERSDSPKPARLATQASTSSQPKRAPKRATLGSSQRSRLASPSPLADPTRRPRSRPPRRKGAHAVRQDQLLEQLVMEQRVGPSAARQASPARARSP